MDNLFTPVNDVTNDVPENAFETLVGDDKKFKDQEALAKSVFHKDSFIAQLQRENAELREATSKAATLEEVKTTILSQLKPQPNDPPSTQQPPVTPPASVASENDLEAKIVTLLEKKETERQVKTNQEKVSEVLHKKLGADAQLILNQKAKELNLSLDYLARVANESPAAFFRLVGIEETIVAPSGAAPRSTQQVPPSSNTTEAYWANMKKNNPSEYFNQANTMKRYKEALAKK